MFKDIYRKISRVLIFFFIKTNNETRIEMTMVMLFVEGVLYLYSTFKNQYCYDRNSDCAER